MTFASGLKAIYVTLQPQKRRDLRAVVQPGAPPNAILALRWRFEPVKHLYSKYIPPVDIIPPDLPPDTSAAYQKALDAEHSLLQSSKQRAEEELSNSLAVSNGVQPGHNMNSAQQHKLTLAAGPPVDKAADVNNDTPEDILRKQLGQLRAKLASTRREIENLDHTPQHLVEKVYEAEKELGHQLRKRRKVSDSIADLEHDIRQRSSVLKAEKKRRRQLDQEIADAQNAASGKAIASAAGTGQESPDPARLGQLSLSRDHLKHQICVREVDLQERRDARQALEAELGSLKLTPVGLTGVVEGKESGLPGTAPDLIQAFSDLHSANLQV